MPGGEKSGILSMNSMVCSMVSSFGMRYSHVYVFAKMNY